MVNGQHMNICYHVDDYKLSHCRSKFNDRTIKFLRQEYEIIFEDGSVKMTVSRGKVHKYIVMTLDYTVRGQVQITMIDILDKICKAFDKAEPKRCGTKTSAAPENLFKINKDCEKLQRNKTVQFHSLSEKTLYATK